MSSFRLDGITIACAFAAALFTTPPLTHAQTPPPVSPAQPAAQAAAPAAPFTAGWQDGFFVPLPRNSSPYTSTILGVYLRPQKR